MRQRSFTQANVSFDEFSYWVTRKLLARGGEEIQTTTGGLSTGQAWDENKDAALDHNMTKPLKLVELAKKGGA